jgi:raffinose/stachyose/melibiose transport system permease protein
MTTLVSRQQTMPGRAVNALPVVAALRHLAYIAASLAMLGPIAWIILLSFKTEEEFSNAPFALPAQFDLSNYFEVLRQPDIWLFVLNSLIVVSGALAIVLVASTMAAYAIARIPFRGSTALFVLFLVSDSIPLIVIIVPLFIVVQHLGLDGSRLSIIMPYAAMNMGVSIYILRGFFRSINSNVEDAARLDGCNTLQLIWHVVLPIARPGLLVVTIINFISYWNEYFIATVIASNQRLLTLPAGLAATIVNKNETNWPVMAAAVVMTLIPVIAVFTVAQEKIVQAWTVAVR